MSALLLRKDYYTISKQVLIPILLFVFGCGQSPQPIEKNQTIWYDSPAQEWNEALPIGNGRIGAMIFGDPIHERIQLNDDSIWPGEMNWDLPSGNSEDLKKIRTLLFQGKNTQADKLFVEKFSNQTIVRSHQTLGDLYVDFDHKDITDYKRTLDISKAIFTTSFKSDGYLVKQEAFASHPDNCMVIKYTSNHPDGLSGQLRLSRPKDDGHPTAAVTTPNQNTIVMIGQASQREGIFRSETTPITTGVEFETQAYIKNKGGVLSNEEDIVSFTNASEMVLYIVNSTSYYAVDQHKQSEKYLADIKNAGYEYLKDRHINDYQKLYNRVSLSLTDQSMEHLTTIERLDSIKAGHVDLGLEALLFQYGRYLLISCSRPETNPANLQGLWNEHIKAPWNADYHMNINLQMNYWPANVTNLEELNQPLFDFTDRLFENGRTV
ncbi:MAG: glycoside hydrolase family 95 protein, partial [Cyclobacteriaceae bacterium]|nr:glycoside hydrolase family 95 protein [Cyclobacteriaceae bacterium HetDA_MAG_MS6]